MSVSKEEFEELKKELETIKLLLVTSLLNTTNKPPKGVLGEISAAKSSISSLGLTLKDFK